VILDDLREWVIAYAGSAGQGYVGRPQSVGEGEVVLSTPYVLSSGYLVGGTPQAKQIARPYILFPLELVVAPTKLVVRYAALLWLRDLDAADFKQVARSLVAAIEEAESMRAGIKAQRSGIVLAPTGLKV
jgi:hypothetical protein